MSAALKTRPPETAPAPAMPARLEATAQVLDFEPGLYSVEILSPETTRAREGLVLPCLKLDPITPFFPGAGRAFVAALSEGGVLAPGAHPTYVRAEGGKASVLLTIYKVAGARVAPELRVRMIGGAPPDHAMSKSTLLPSLKLSLLAHVERSGDLTAVGGEWVGQHGGGGGAIEGFAITPGEAIGPGDIEYQAVLGNDWSTPWVRGGAFCGSRGLALPLLGVRMRIVGDAARKFRLSYWGYFGDCGEVGPLLDGETCGADGAPLEALRVVIEARSSAPSPAPKLVPASRDLISKSRNVIEALKRPAPTATKKPRR